MTVSPNRLTVVSFFVDEIFLTLHFIDILIFVLAVGPVVVFRPLMDGFHFLSKVCFLDTLLKIQFLKLIIDGPVLTTL